MTLILASIRPNDVVLTADGRSITLDNGRVVGIDDHYQKLFPVPDHPLVIAHMGENLLDGKPVKNFLHPFIRHLNAGNLTILEIADQLREYAHPAIRARFEKLGTPAFGVNLWVVGFTYHEEGPRMVEVFWRRSNGVLTTEERHFEPIAVVPGGSGQHQIDHVDWHRIADKSIKQIRAYHRSLMKEATHAKVENNSVGGRIHELVINPDRCHWTRRPRSHS